MFTNNLPENINLTNGFIESDGFGLGWALRVHENDFFLPKGSVYWAGAANTYFAIDLNRKIGIVYFSNYFPVPDEGAFGFYKLFGREEFSKILE